MMNIEDQPKISVVIRKRPLNKKEIQRNENDIVIVRNGETVIVSEYKQKVDLTKYIEESSFNFDHAFDESSNNTQIYAKAVRPLVESAFMGAKVTCFAYGQTGSGKTYTMNGDLANGVEGLYILGAKDIFNFRSNKQFQHLKIQVSFFEIYCSRLFDLLNNRNQLKIREDNKGNVHIVGLEEKPLNSAQQFMNIIEYGSGFRVTSQNSTNADSSRSHAILQITLKQGKKVYGKISFIDLAGCQRGADHMDQNKQTRIDGAEINKSLLSLKECIRALDQGKGHTPFRGSKLTMVLKDSFVGFCRTVMIGNISPNITSCENTLNTLRYADRVKELKKPNSTEPLSKQQQLAKELMLPRHNNNAVKIMIDKDDDAEDIQLKKQEAQKLLGIKNFDVKPTLPQQIPFGQNNANLMRSDFNNLSLNGNQMNNNNNNSKKMVIENPVVRKFSMEQKGPVLRFDQSGDNRNPYPNQLSLRNQKANYLQDQKTIKQNASFNNGSSKSQQLQNIPSGNSLKQFQQGGNNQTFKNLGQQQNYVQQQPQMNQNNYQYENQQQRSFNPYGFQQQQQNQPLQFNMKNNEQIFGQKQQQQQQQPTQFGQFVQNQYQQNHQQQPPHQIQRSFSMNQNLMNSSMTPNNNNNNFNSNFNNNFNQNNNNNKMIPESNNNVPNKQNFNNPLKKNDWESMIGEFRSWNPAHHTHNLGYFKEIHESLINKLVQEEDEITQLHSNSINKEIELIKGETKVISEIQQDKQAYDSMEYAQYIQNTIEKKINHLLEMKKRVEEFKGHLREHQECQQKLFKAKQILDDEQLLDDLPAEDYEFNDYQNDEDTNNYQMQQYNQQPLY